MRLFIALDEADVRAQADASATGARHKAPLGPLDGVPIAVKDEYDVAATAPPAAPRSSARRPRDGATRWWCARLRGGGRDHLRQDQHARARDARRAGSTRAPRHGAQPVRSGARHRRLVVGLGRRGRRRASCPSRSATTAAARCASPRRFAACVGSRPPSGASRPTGCALLVLVARARRPARRHGGRRAAAFARHDRRAAGAPTELPRARCASACATLVAVGRRARSRRSRAPPSSAVARRADSSRSTCRTSSSRCRWARPPSASRARWRSSRTSTPASRWPPSVRIAFEIARGHDRRPPSSRRSARAR